MISVAPFTPTPAVVPQPAPCPSPRQHVTLQSATDAAPVAGQDFAWAFQNTDVDGADVRLLVVDDDLATIEFLGKLLRGFAQVSFATNGDDALRLAILQQPDLILLDIEMPGRSGFDVCQRLREEPALAAVPIIFATSHIDPLNEALALDLGANDFLHKPFEPVQVMARLRAQLRTRPTPARAVDADSRPARILLIDDDPGVIQVVRRLLRAVGDCHFSLNAHEAVGVAHELRPDLILLDIGMPHCDGLHLCRRLRSDPSLKHVPIMFLTQSTSVDEEAEALALGGDDFVRKPFNATVLLARVRRLVDRKRSVEQHLLLADQNRRKLSNARMASIVAACSDAIVIADMQDHIVLANASAGDLFGLSTDQLRQLALGQVLQRCDGTRRTVRHAMGHEIPVDVSVSHDGTGADALTVLVLRDTLERDMRETQTRHHDQLAARRASAALLVSVAQALGAPLRCMSGQVQQAMADKTAASHPVDWSGLVRLDDAAKEMIATLRDVNHLAKVMAGHLLSEPEPLDVLAAVRLACQQAVRHRPDGATWITVSGEQVHGVLADADSFQQCLEKFLYGMLLIAGAGLNVEVLSRDKAAVISVTSPGSGLTTAQLQQLCHPQPRLSKESTQAPILPLGFALARELAQSFGARFQACASGKIGCRLELLIPLASELA